MTKTLVVFVVLIAVAGFLTYKYVVQGDCLPSAVGGGCVGATTGYPEGPVGAGGVPAPSVEIGLP